jgi:hypothetical protein
LCCPSDHQVHGDSKAAVCSMCSPPFTCGFAPCGEIYFSDAVTKVRLRVRPSFSGKHVGPTPVALRRKPPSGGEREKKPELLSHKREMKAHGGISSVGSFMITQATF